jgi:hypothetical protein
MKKALITTGLGLATIFGAVTITQAQTYRDYRQAQRAQEKAMKEQQKQARRIFRQTNGRYRDQYGNVITVNSNGYYVDQLGNVYDRNGYVISSSGNRAIIYPNNTYNNRVVTYPSSTYNNRYSYTYNPGTTGYYRIYSNGSYYNTDYRGYEMLRSAVNSGYQQGYYEGQRDRSQGKRFDYTDEDSYRYGNYGYNSYVDSGQYQYYFRQGFSRGYQDGYYSTSRYGYRTGSTAYILGSILDTIVNLSNQ